jgi:hypothetical protein
VNLTTPRHTHSSDVITLAYVGAEVSTPLTPRQIRRAYPRHTRDHGAQWTDVGLTRALTLWVQAAGLHSVAVRRMRMGLSEGGRPGGTSSSFG